MVKSQKQRRKENESRNRNRTKAMALQLPGLQKEDRERPGLLPLAHLAGFHGTASTSGARRTSTAFTEEEDHQEDQ